MTKSVPQCRFCGSALTRTLVDLGEQPLANSFLHSNDLGLHEPRYPLRVRVCDRCFLAQADASVPPGEIFAHYVYYSSVSESWLRHARVYCELVTERFSLGPHSKVVEIASNDGYLLRNFVAAGIPCLGIEPAKNIADDARASGVPTITAFLTEESGRRIAGHYGAADLVCGANVLAHVPDIADFTRGLIALMKPDGVLTIEFPHLQQLIAECQFDTIYHEHFSYLSLVAIERIFIALGLRLFDCETLPTHGGSLRIYAQRADAPVRRPEATGLRAVRAGETAAGLDRPAYYDDFQQRVDAMIASLRRFLDEARADNKVVVSYGAAAKGNTLLNSCKIAPGEIAYVVDRNKHKQGLYLPGTRLEVCAPERVAETRPDYLLILPWNLKDEIVAQMRFIADWQGRFVTPGPFTRVFTAS
jgi:hypothetical protein